MFPKGLFCDPAWDMLLDLLVSEPTGSAISVSSLCIASGAPHSTALRHLRLLIQAGLATRSHDASDRRRSHVRLTDRCRELLQQVLAGSRS